MNARVANRNRVPVQGRCRLHSCCHRSGTDIRRAGSGNVGATNVLRTSGVLTALTVVALDIAKGIGSVLVVQRFAAGDLAPAAAGLAAIVGHIYPVWLRFNGGKGVADVVRRVLRVLAPAATGSRARALRRDRVAHALRVAGIDRRDGRARSDRVARACVACRRPAVGRRRRGDSVPPSSQPGRLAGGTERRHGSAGLVMRAAVLGAGGFGTALAVHLAGCGHPVRLWARDRRWPPR